MHQIGKTHIYGSKPIDSLAASQGIIDYIDGCELLSNNDIVESDHRSCMIDIALEYYFEDELCEWDNINKVTLNPARRSRREKFIDKLEHQMQMHNVEDDLSRMENSFSNQEIETIDEVITRMFTATTKKVEGMKRNVPCSKEKEKRKSLVSCYKMRMRELKGGIVD